MRPLLLLLLATSAAADPASLLDELRRQTGVAGMAASLSIDGEVCWHAETGSADIEARLPVSGETLFRLASVSKALCSVMAAGLIEDGVIDVDTTVGALLPELAKQYRELTFRDLMTHTSGLPHYQARDALRGRKRYSTAIDGLEQLGDRSLVAEPGDGYLYSTHGFSLASAMLEAASERTFPELFDDRIAGDIHLEHAIEGNERRSRLYSGAKREIEPEDFSYSWCGAGMAATTIALTDFVSSEFGGSGQLGDEGIALLVAPLPDRAGRTVDAGRWQMTLGWRRSFDANGDVYLHHAGVTNGARSIVAVWPDSGKAVALLSNASWTGRMEDTAVAFALADAQAAGNCAVDGAVDYSGSFGDDAMSATIEWRNTASGCRGGLRGDNALSRWAARFNFGDADELALLRLDEQRWGLVSPVGIAILSGDINSLTGTVGSRQLTLEQTTGNHGARAAAAAAIMRENKAKNRP
ncbi:MAG: serine hydrolase domain-containing protein [Woeseiaceae bacterium]|nr:serine hydrolase domain-containing protein [Woeseiaceae bacterium]